MFNLILPYCWFSLCSRSKNSWTRFKLESCVRKAFQQNFKISILKRFVWDLTDTAWNINGTSHRLGILLFDIYLHYWHGMFLYFYNSIWEPIVIIKLIQLNAWFLGTTDNNRTYNDDTRMSSKYSKMCEIIDETNNGDSSI